MAHSTSRQAIQAHVADLRGILTGVVRQPLALSTGNPDPDDPAQVVADRGMPMALQGGTTPVALRARQRHTLIGDLTAPVRARYTLQVVAYDYSVFIPSTSMELLAFHLHPTVIESGSRGQVIHFPLRVMGNAAFAIRALGRWHVPNGHIHLEDVIRLLIEVHEVTPLRAAWQALVARVRLNRTEA